LKPVLERWAKNPILFVTEAFDNKGNPIVLEEWQKEALTAIQAHDRVAIRSGHGVGKSAFLAWVILWWHVTRFPAKTPCTSPTAHQLEDVLWGELGKWHRMLREPMKSWLEVKSDRLEFVEATGESFAVARTARKEQPEAFQGFHSENLLFIVDEASGVEDIIFEVGQGAMSTKGAKTLMTGNPTRTSGYFFDAFHKMRARWSTMRVACQDSTQVSSDYPDELAEQFGEDSNVYRVRVLGEFPNEDENAVIALHLCEAAMVREVDPSNIFKTVWGVDVARFGSDRTALAKRRGNIQLEPVRSWHGKDTMQVAGLIIAEYEETPEEDRPSEILVDVIGIGAGVVDRLNEQSLPVRGVNVAESPAVADRFLRLRDELWFKVREALEARDCKLADDDALVAELTGVRYNITSAGKIKVESKDEMKKRGLRSCDLADAWCLTFAGGTDLLEAPVRKRYRPRRSGNSWMSA
jgi:phage terminase large subunit